MNKEYICLSDKVLVTDENGKITEEKVNNNISEILVAENNLEVIENTLECDLNKR